MSREFTPPGPSSVSYHTYVWLKEHQHDFDIIHFPECQGLGFYSLLAKRQGLAFTDTYLRG